MNRRRHLHWTLGLIFCAGCQQVESVQAPTEIMLRINNTDEALRAQMTELRVTLSVRQGGEWHRRTPLGLASKGLTWPVDIPITPSAGSTAAQQIEVVVDALTAGKSLAQTRAITNFVANKHRLLDVFLYVCPGHTLDDAFSCAVAGCKPDSCQVCNSQGVCEQVTPTPGSSLAAFDADAKPQNKPPADDEDDGGPPEPDDTIAHADAGPDGGDAEVDTEPLEVAIHEPNTACSNPGERACAQHDSTIDLVCGEGVWTADAACAQDARCDTQLGATQGTCQQVAALCARKSPGDAVCDGTARKRCDADRLRYEDDDCAAHAHCTGSTTARCACDAGYRDNGSGQCTNIDDCGDNTCGQGGVCIDAVDDYRCKCDPGFAGDDTRVCTDIDECNRETDVCTPDYPCQNSAPYYSCRGQFADWKPVDSGAGADTGLEWTIVPSQNGGAAEDTWQHAKDACATMAADGGGWRLPTIAELESVVDYSRAYPYNALAVVDYMDGWCWSASPYVGASDSAWFVTYDGASSYRDTANIGCIACVR